MQDQAKLIGLFRAATKLCVVSFQEKGNMADRYVSINENFDWENLCDFERYNVFWSVFCKISIKNLHFGIRELN